MTNKEVIINRTLQRFDFTGFPKELHEILQKYQDLANILAAKNELKAMRALFISRGFIIERLLMRSGDATS